MFGGPSEVIPKKAMAAAELAANGSESGLIISFAGDAKYQIVCNTHEISQPKFPEFSSYRPGRGGERRSREPSRLDATGTPSVSYNTAKIVIIARTRLRVLRKKVRTQHTHTHAHMRAPGHDHDGER